MTTPVQHSLDQGISRSLIKNSSSVITPFGQLSLDEILKNGSHPGRSGVNHLDLFPVSFYTWFLQELYWHQPQGFRLPEVASFARASALVFCSRGICSIDPRSNADNLAFTFAK